MPHLQRARDHIDRIAPDLIQLRSPDVPGEYVAGSGAPIETVNGATKWQGYGWISERPDTSSAMNVASQLVQEDTHTVAISIDALPEPGDIIEILSSVDARRPLLERPDHGERFGTARAERPDRRLSLIVDASQRTREDNQIGSCRHQRAASAPSRIWFLWG